jgi:hypothetical protein
LTWDRETFWAADIEGLKSQGRVSVGVTSPHPTTGLAFKIERSVPNSFCGCEYLKVDARHPGIVMEHAQGQSNGRSNTQLLSASMTVLFRFSPHPWSPVSQLIVYRQRDGGLAATPLQLSRRSASVHVFLMLDDGMLKVRLRAASVAEVQSMKKMHPPATLVETH